MSARLEILARQLTAGDSYAAGDIVPAAASAALDREPLLTEAAQYERMYQWSIRDPTAFWSAMAQDFYWKTPFKPQHHSANIDVSAGPISIKWFEGGTTNLCYNALDKWVQSGAGDRPCFVWEGNDAEKKTMTYSQVLADVCKLANWLRSKGVKKGDIVAVYLPMVCDLPITMLACARIGALHNVVFAGFSADSLASRILDCGAKVVITASGVMRGTKPIPLKGIVDAACAQCVKAGAPVSHVLVLEEPSLPAAQTPWNAKTDEWWHKTVTGLSSTAEVEWLQSEDRSFLLYTSGSTGKPKGVVHTIGGYMVAAATSCKFILDVRPGDMYWCTADCGWITGHTYLVYGPLLCGATAILFGATPTHPDAGRIWRMVQEYKVRQLYTSPTLLRGLLALGDSWVTRYDRSSLKLIGVVGEPINTHAWNWTKQVIGENRCPVVDTWWQTETGSMMITPFPGTWCPQIPGVASLPMFGVLPVVLDAQGKVLTGACEGLLALGASTPSMARTLHGDHQRFADAYFGPFKGYYFTGDGCRRDKDGLITITGRVDDVINVSGHRIGTAEVESALAEHEDCAEAACVGIDHAMKGQSIYAYVTLREGAVPSDKLHKELLQHVRNAIGPFATPDTLHYTPTGLPKTRSGKVLRRVLRKIAMHLDNELGDISTCADPSVVQDLINSRKK